MPVGNLFLGRLAVLAQEAHHLPTPSKQLRVRLYHLLTIPQAHLQHNAVLLYKLQRQRNLKHKPSKVALLVAQYRANLRYDGAKRPPYVPVRSLAALIAFLVPVSLPLLFPSSRYTAIAYKCSARLERRPASARAGTTKGSERLQCEFISIPHR
jgi:hypothetical protein